MIAPPAAPARLYGREDGSGPGAGIEAFGLMVRIEIGKWDLVVSASPVPTTAGAGCHWTIPPGTVLKPYLNRLRPNLRQ